LQPVPTRDTLAANTINLAADGRGASGITPQVLVAWAIERGFERLGLVESPGDIAQRGDIVDLFIPGEPQPHRIQFFDDAIESIRCFDISTQRSLDSVPALDITLLKNGIVQPAHQAADLFDYLPPDTIIVLDGPSEIQEMGTTIRSRLGNTDRLFRVQDVLARCEQFNQLFLSPLATPQAPSDRAFHFDVTSVARFEGDAAEAVSELCRAAADHTIYVVCDNDGECQRLREMIREKAPDVLDQIHTPIGVLHRGFE